MGMIKVTIVTASGETREQEVIATGATVAEVRQAAGVADARMGVLVNGSAARDNDHVPDGATVKFSERAAGS